MLHAGWWSPRPKNECLPISALSDSWSRKESTCPPSAYGGFWRNPSQDAVCICTVYCKGVSLPPAIYVDPPLLLPDCDHWTFLAHAVRLERSNRLSFWNISKYIQVVAWFMCWLLIDFSSAVGVVSRAWHLGLGGWQWWIISHEIYCHCMSRSVSSVTVDVGWSESQGGYPKESAKLRYWLDPGSLADAHWPDTNPAFLWLPGFTGDNLPRSLEKRRVCRYEASPVQLKHHTRGPMDTENSIMGLNVRKLSPWTRKLSCELWLWQARQAHQAIPRTGQSQRERLVDR